ncbi:MULTISPECIES: DUF6253 family protein [Streptomyces]|uniref:DUF6253 family protein n=1 Tax=Streptomyces TaxID=1883 RepID=UPI001671FEFA|nr:MULTISPECIES: DUF6253 family protein [Streptomyces]MBK3521295.1 hypothetical protein [Streptomyces sp. MBT70]GGS11177.1 hypothetical protein GCM10010236_77050 [Streptomyces eurythermus]
MSLLAADGHVALFVTDEGDARQLPLVCWRDNGTAVHGMVLYRGALRQAEQVPGFRRYAGPLEHDTPAPHGYASRYPLESDTLVRRGNVSFHP